MPPPKKKPKFVYSHEDLLKALEAVKNGESVNAASKRFGIPQSTLAYKVAGKTPIERRMGPEPLLGAQAEELLTNWIKGLAVRGFAISKANLLISVQQVAKDLNLNEKIPVSKLGSKWMTLFFKRHPELCQRKPEQLSKVRASVTEEAIRNWYAEVEKYLVKNGYITVLSDPDRVFNLDETSFFLCPKTGKVIAEKGQKNVYHVHSGSDKENLTVLCTISASGKVAPTLVVFPGQRLPQSIRLQIPDDWALAKSESGWMNGETFYEFIANVFYRWLKDQGTKFPVIVFLDGHKSHLTYHLSIFCSKNNIILVALPPNCTHILQPLDVALFGPIKREWSAAVHKWQLTNGVERLTKYTFSPLLKEVLDSKLKEESIKNGFKRCGLYPFNANEVDYTKVSIMTQTPSEKHPIDKNTDNEESGSHSSQHCLEFVEQFINPDVLIKFKETFDKFTPVWTGAEEFQALYVVWKKAKDFVVRDTLVSRPSVTTTPNTCQLSTLSTTTPLLESIRPETFIMETADDVLKTPQKEPEIPLEMGPMISGELSEDVDDPGLGPSTIATPSTSRDELARVLSPNTNGEGVPSPFKNNLFWPGTPPKTKAKKGAKKIKLPSVVTSKQWQDYEEKRREEKKKTEEKKEERKKLREERQKKKTTTKTASKKKLVYDEEEDWTCKKCMKRYSAELILNIRRRWIECDSCKGTYHFKCLPKKHLEVFGLEESDEDDDELQFICHVCAKDCDSDNDPFVLSETDSD